jgi:hypothetical protein
LYIAIVRHEETNIMALLREKVRKRHRGLADRRRIKASDLIEHELIWLINNFKPRYDGIALTISDFSDIKENTSYIKDWKIKILASAVYLTCRDLVKSGDVILIDRDYSENVMKNLFNYLELLFRTEGKKVVIESGTSFNEVIAKADLIAGCLRGGVIRARKAPIKEITRLVKML